MIETRPVCRDMTGPCTQTKSENKMLYILKPWSKHGKPWCNDEQLLESNRKEKKQLENDIAAVRRCRRTTVRLRVVWTAMLFKAFEADGVT